MSLKREQIKSGRNCCKGKRNSNKKQKKQSNRKMRRLMRDLEYSPSFNRYDGWYY